VIRSIRKQLSDVLWVIALVVVAVAVGSYIVVHQRLTWPEWMPVVGEQFFDMEAEFQTVSGVLPGQGQQVTVSGVQVGEIGGVKLENGVAIAKLRIEPRFARVYPDATMLLRPKTSLKDMIVELDPGTKASGPRLKEGARLTSAQTDPDVNFDEILASLDGDTRAYLTMLVTDGAAALGDGNGRELASTFKRFEPLSRHAAQASKLVAQRRDKLERLMGNLSKLADELGGRDEQLGQFVNASADVFRHFSAQNANLERTLQKFPPTLEATDDALGKVAKLGSTLNTALDDLEPTSRALAPTLRKVRPFLKETTPVLKDDLRPFTREVQDEVRKLRPAAEGTARATPELTTLANLLNELLDTLAYDPPGEGKGNEGYLFFVPWANHNTNSVLAQQDGVGAVRRSLMLMSCGTLRLMESQRSGENNPILGSLTQMLNVPLHSQVCKDDDGGGATR